MINSRLTTGSICRLHPGERELARLSVFDADWRWMYASVAALPGFEEILPLFVDQEGASEEPAPTAPEEGLVHHYDRLYGCGDAARRLDSGMESTSPARVWIELIRENSI